MAVTACAVVFTAQVAAGREPQTCGNDRRRAIWEKAKLDGVDFRATGNEPPWVLEIQQQSRAVLLTDCGAQRVEVPLPPPQEDRGTRNDAVERR